MNSLSCLVMALIAFASIGCRTKTGGVLQVATNDTFVQGNYDGKLTLTKLKSFGDMGIGTFHRLDGTMILINGDIYQIHANGEVTIPSDSQTTPFATVTLFEPTYDREINQIFTLDQLKSKLNQIVENQNVFCFYYIRGHFKNITFYNLPIQRKPYAPIAEVLKKRETRQVKETYGSLVGIRVPAYLSGLQQEGFTFYFLNEARNNGGYVENAIIQNPHIRIDHQHQWLHLYMPLL